MQLILRNVVLYSVLFFSISLFSQKGVTFELEGLDIDSILNATNLSSKERSAIHHSYASVLFKKNLAKQSYIHLKKAIALRKKSGDLISLKKSLFNLGLYYRRENQVFKSIHTFKELSDLPNEDRLRMKSYSELITLYSIIGDYEKSKLYFIKSTEYYIYKKDYRNLYKNYMRISKVYASIDGKTNFEKTIGYLKKADSLGEFTPIEKRDESLINLRLGFVYEEVEKKDKAIYHYEKALKTSKELNDSISISMLNNNIADLYLQHNEYIKAKAKLDNSLLFAGDEKESKALVYSTYGTYYLQKNSFYKAKFYYEKALQLLVEESDVKKFENPSLKSLAVLPNKLHVLDFISQKANYWHTRYKVDKNESYLQKALQDYKLADQLLDVIRFESSEKRSKLFWRKQGASLYIKAIEVCYLLNNVNDAYFFLEKNKALLLIEELSHQKAQVLSHLPQELIERDFALKQGIVHAEESNLSNKTDKIFELKQAYEQFKDSLAHNYPEYSILRKKLPVLHIKNHKDYFVNKSSVSLQYIINETKAFGLVITEHNSYLFKINDATSLQKEVIKLTQQLQHPFETQFALDAYAKNSNSIFKRLLPEEVFNKIKGKRIIISADGIVQNIPFGALISNYETPDSYLIKTNEISYVHSFSYLNLNKRKSRNPKHTFLGMAPKNFKDKTLATLANSVDEVNYINSIFSDKIFINKQATKSNFVSSLGDYKIIHLATHSGSSDTEKPWLAFSDERINLNEMHATKNQADLVVLSACKTSQGEMKTGEGVMSLARGFFFSGTNSVISTLWNINDKTTLEIMHSFYTNLKNGMTKSRALHESKLTYLSKHEGTLSTPFYWSSYVLIGDMNTIVLNDGFSRNYMFVLFASVAVILFLMYKYLSKR